MHILMHSIFHTIKVYFLDHILSLQVFGPRKDFWLQAQVGPKSQHGLSWAGDFCAWALDRFSFMGLKSGFLVESIVTCTPSTYSALGVSHKHLNTIIDTSHRLGKWGLGFNWKSVQHQNLGPSLQLSIP